MGGLSWLPCVLSWLSIVTMLSRIVILVFSFWFCGGGFCSLLARLFSTVSSLLCFLTTSHLRRLTARCHSFISHRGSLGVIECCRLSSFVGIGDVIIHTIRARRYARTNKRNATTCRPWWMFSEGSSSLGSCKSSDLGSFARDVRLLYR